MSRVPQPSRWYALIVGALMAGGAFAQCPNNNTVIAGGAITPLCPGTTNVPCVQGGQYALVNVVAGNAYTFSTCGASFDTQITLYNNAGGASLGYNDDSGTCGLFSTQSVVNWTATFTGQLRVLVDLYNCVNNTTCAPLTITCSPPPPPVTNTAPCNALPLTLVQTCGGGTYSNVGAGNSNTLPAPTCGFYPAGAQDVWFTFVAGPLGSVNLQSSAGSMTDGVMAVYSAPSCSGPFTQLACNDDAVGLMPALALNGLTPGQTYYVRFWGYGTATGTFNLCAQGLQTLPPGDCVYVLNLFDSFGDGWGTSSVGYSINGGAFQYWTITGTSGQVVIGVNFGDSFVLDYIATGAFQDENSFTIQIAGSGTLYNSGSPPAAGIQFPHIVDCVTPPAPPEDCEGAITICSNQAFNANTNNTGSVADLNAANQGCLSASERQGTWYTFSPSTSGTVAFTISPTDPTDDYDFAMWGPYPPGSTTANVCPPAGAPVRCSFAAPSGDTGLNFTATDVSESPSGDKWVRYLDVVQDQVYLMYISNFSQSGLAFGLNWNPAMTAELDCTVLTAELTGLVATPAADRVELAWTTLSEENSHRFVVERSGDGERFVELGFLPAQGNSQVRTDYRFQDRAPLKGVNYYRLRSVDLDGAAELSNVAVVRFGISAPLLAPNPAQNELTLLWDNSGDTPVEVRITDGSGRLVAVRNLTGAGTRHGLQVHDLEGGAYLLSLHGQDGSPLGQVRFIKE